jgi:hypothetical protein
VNDRWRLALKLLWMATLVAVLVLFSQVRHAFVYQGF